MLRKRLIGVVTVRDGWAVQSFSYQRYLPLGKPECLVENLDRWGVDEIFIQEIDRSLKMLGPNIELIEKIADRCVSTPILYAGGIATQAQAVQVVRAGVERVCLDALLHDNPDEVREIANRLGSQAVLASMPLVKDAAGRSQWYNYKTKQAVGISKRLLTLINEGAISEMIAIDKDNEGSPNSFNFELLTMFSDSGICIPIIPFGGLSEAEQLEQALFEGQVSAVAVGNFLNYREHAVQALKSKLVITQIRPPYYGSQSLV